MEFSVPFAEGDFLPRLVDAVADPIFVKDRDHRWVLFNKAFCELLGRPRKELLGKSDYDFFPKAQADVFRRQDELVFETGVENVNEEMLTDAQGRTHVLSTRKNLWVSPGGSKYLFGVIRDMTEIVGAADERGILEERLRRAQKLETLGSMAGGVAHDFNNLLTAILGCAGLMLDSLPKDHPSRGEVEEIRTASERAAALTGQLLSFGRRPRGMARRVDLRTIVSGMNHLLRRLLPPDVELLVKPSKGCVVRVDPGVVEQALLNLALNAGEALPRGGKVTVEVSRAPKGGGGLAGPCARLTVRDDGEGMSESVRSRIFEPFFTTKEHGSGLGLSTVAEIVRRSGGAVDVQSAPGEGAAFHVHWPLASGRAEGAPARSPAGAPAEPLGRALVVDDDDAVRRFVVRCLEREGYEVLSASQPAEALRLGAANNGLFDLLVIDIVMPRMGGPELAKRLQEGQPGARVLFTSGRRREDCGLPDGEAFLPKPFSSEGLLRKVSDAARPGAGGPSPRARRPARARSRRRAS